jgi:myo-inositol 2-dehydrogenase/D-chiro-inositol 1-dehydrogenase
MAKKIRTAVIGAGRIGRLHAENLARFLPAAELVAIADIDQVAASRTAAELKIPVVAKNYGEILDQVAVEAILICSPSDTHANIIETCAEAGVHIFCEKPIDIELARVRQVLDKVERTGVKLQVGFNRRFDASFRRIKNLVSQGEIGTPHLLRITSRDPAPPTMDYLRDSGGIFLDMTIHDFDMARFLMQSEVEEVFAAGAVLVDPALNALNDVDTAVVTLRFDNGALGTIDNSRKAVYGYDQRIEVFGSKGMLSAMNETADQVHLLNEKAESTSKPLNFFTERYRHAYTEEVRAFINAILDDTEPPVTGVDGLMPLKIGLAAKRSCAENRPVKLAEIEER